MDRIRSFILAHKIPVIIAAVVFFAAAVFVLFTFGKETTEVVQAKTGPFVQQVSASGKVTPADTVAMSFEHTGRVTRIYVEVGEAVKKGDPLAALDTGTLAADLKAAEAQVALRRIDIENTEDSLEKVKSQQDTIVASAYRDLLAEDLAAVQQSSTGVTPPSITGAYKGTAEGTYRFRILQPQLGVDIYELQVFGLESLKPVRISREEPTPLGTLGLFVTFPTEVRAYRDTSWEVVIPNIRSASYRDNYNAYQEALRERDRKVAEAQTQLRESASGLTAAQAQLQSAQAEVSRIRTEIAERTLRAPYDGTVTSVDIELGGAVSISDPAVSLISNGALEIESFVPEINIANLSVGDVAAVTLDAYGESVSFEGVVLAIDPSETIRDGVSTYRVRLSLPEDERIRPGMTANVLITTDERESVLTIPQGAAALKGGKWMVKVVTDSGVTDRQVTVGAVSSLGEIEILSGLAEGEQVRIR